MQVSTQDDKLRVFPRTEDREMPSIWLAREDVSQTRGRWTSVFTDESRFSLESDSGRPWIWRNNMLDTTNPTLSKDSYRGGGVMVCTESSLGFQTALLCSMEELWLVWDIWTRFFIHMPGHISLLQVITSFWWLIRAANSDFFFAFCIIYIFIMVIK